MTRGKPQQETSVGDGGDSSHVGGGGGWGGGNDSIAGGGCGGDDSDRGAAAESSLSSSDGASIQDDTRPGMRPLGTRHAAEAAPCGCASAPHRNTERAWPTEAGPRGRRRR